MYQSWKLGQAKYSVRVSLEPQRRDCTFNSGAHFPLKIYSAIGGAVSGSCCAVLLHQPASAHAFIGTTRNVIWCTRHARTPMRKISLYRFRTNEKQLEYSTVLCKETFETSLHEPNTLRSPSDTALILTSTQRHFVVGLIQGMRFASAHLLTMEQANSAIKSSGVDGPEGR